MTASRYFLYILFRNHGNFDEMRKCIATFIRVMHERMDVLRGNHFEGNNTGGRCSRRTIIATNKESSRVIKANVDAIRSCVIAFSARGICACISSHQCCRHRFKIAFTRCNLPWEGSCSGCAKCADRGFISLVNNEKQSHRRSNSVRFRSENDAY